MRWGSRSHGNPGGEALLDQMQAVLAQRDWQWSPEYGDGLQDGDTHQSSRRSRGGSRGSPKPQSGSLDAGAPGPISEAAAADGRTQHMPQQLQMLLNGGQTGPQGLQEQQQNWTPASGSGWSDAMQAPTNGRPHQHGGNQLHLLLGVNGGHHGTASFQEPQMQQSWPTNGGWPDGMQEENKRRAAELASYTGRLTDQTQSYAPQLEVSEFPHAITTPDVNIMHMNVPQEVRAIWG